MSNHSFRFKQFVVRHDRCAMKVGTDGVLLGAWASVENARSVLDIGTGSGVIALLVAQRTGPAAHIDALDISLADIHQATDNVLASPWPDKITPVHSSLQQFSPPKTYDHIISNPPFFTSSTAPPVLNRKQARHTTELSHDELLLGVKKVMSPDGILSIILPTTEGALFQTRASAFGLYCSRKTAFFARKEKPQERWLMEFEHGAGGEPVPGRLVLFGDLENWSEDYKHLVRPFYLDL